MAVRCYLMLTPNDPAVSPIYRLSHRRQNEQGLNYDPHKRAKHGFMSPIDSTKRWLDTMVIGHNLCPFAKQPLAEDRVRFVETAAKTEDALLVALQQELTLLQTNDAIHTTLLIHPAVLQNFTRYNQFLAAADALVAACQLDGVFQIASFHPSYQFAGTSSGAAENYSNRSPYPLLHILREDQVSAAINRYPKVSDIPANNIARLNLVGSTKLHALWQSCFGANGHF